MQQAAVQPDSPVPASPALVLVPGGEAPEPPQPPQRRIVVPPYDLEAARGLERMLGVSHTLAQVLVRRDLADPDAAGAFLEAGECHPVEGFAGLEQVLDVIQRHISGGGRIVVHGDYDADGVCATAIMVRALRALGADVGWFLPSRLEDGYGLAEPTVERLAARGTDLLVTVDCGITAIDAVARARALGLDVVVTDHHAALPGGELPDCPLVHPGACGYPCPELCGSGVALKLAEALGAETAAEDLELAALATVADLMPLRGENRRLVREGLAALARTTRPGLRALMSVSSVDPSALDARALGFRLAPRLNAAGRVRRADAGLELLLTEDPGRAREIAAELDALNAERRAIEQRIVWEAEAQVAELGERRAYVLAGEGWHPGVVGIVASRIVERHHRPTVVIALDGEASAHGSGRSIPGFDLLGALHGAAGELEGYGGHRAAAGLTIAPGRVDRFREAFEAHAREVLTPELLQPVERVDAIVSGPELGLPLAEELELLAPCGIGNPAPRLLVPGARFGDVRAMGEGRHARFTVSSGGARARAVAFGCDGSVATGDTPMDGIFALERNVWGGAVEPRLVLRHCSPCEPAAIAVLGEPEGFLEAAWAELEAPLLTAPAARPVERRELPLRRELLDRRGEGPLAVLADALATGGPVLALCADVARRRAGLQDRTGGFSLAGWHALEREPGLADPFTHLIALDPPTTPGCLEQLSGGSGYAHLAWGEAELRFARQMHEHEYGLRDSLVALYRSLRDRGRATGEELERLLRGDGRPGRPARLAGRLVRVLVELGLVSIDRDHPALAVAGAGRTSLERSPAYRAYATRYEDGRRFLNSASVNPSQPR